jgi:hypothetical protein
MRENPKNMSAGKTEKHNNNKKHFDCSMRNLTNLPAIIMQIAQHSDCYNMRINFSAKVLV